MIVNLKISKSIFNPVYVPHLYNNHRTQIYYGGSSSGKSFFFVKE